MVCGEEMRHCNFYHESLGGKAITADYNSNTTKIISSGRSLKALQRKLPERIAKCTRHRSQPFRNEDGEEEEEEKEEEEE